MKGFFVAVLIAGSLSGCSYERKAQWADELEKENAYLKTRIAYLEKDKEREVRKVREEKEEEISDLERAKRELEASLKKEIDAYQAKLEMTERGLVITFVSEVFFDSGKDTVRSEGMASLGKVADVLIGDVPDSSVAVEGHTDNQPIRYSGWTSNWELASARALAVLHYLVEKCGVSPERLSANSYGEFRPVAPNTDTEGMQKNRRVEIVILPSNIAHVKPD
jgi:chemotaxis protein MotB